MIASYKNEGTRDVHYGYNTTKARKVCPPNLWSQAIKKLNMVRAARTLNDLASPPNNKLEKLKGNRAGQYSIRINERLRVCFEWDSANAVNVEIVDYH
jgi:proteic killer suppression protein